MKDYRQLIKELPSKTVVMAFGRFNPPTIGHELLVKAVKKLAQQRNADHVIYASRTQDAKKNPLSVDKKVKYLNLMFRNTHFAAADNDVRTFIEAAKMLNKKHKNIIMVAGSDRVSEFNRLLNTYNGKEFKYDTIEVISAGERDPDADDASGMSASKMRAIASKGNYQEFKKGLPSSVRDIDGRRLMNDIRDGMGLEPIKEQLNLVKDDLRERYFRGEIFNEGDIVECNGDKFTIVKRGSNHLLLKEQNGTLVSKWIQDVQPTEEKTMSEQSLTDKTLKSSDKIKIARVIASMLGVDNVESSSNPENLVNMALRKVRNKPFNPEGISILKRMLDTASQMGIKYDETLVPTKIKEGVIQPNGTDKIDPAADSPVVNKKSNYNFAKDILRFNDFKKLKKVQEQHKGEESKADHDKDNESDIDADYDSHKKDAREVGHTLVSPGGQDNLRRRKVKYHLGEQKQETGMEITKKIMKKGMTTYGKEGGHELTAQHIISSPEHTGKQKKIAQSFISKMQGAVAEQVSTKDDREQKQMKKANLAAKHAREKELLSVRQDKEKAALKEVKNEIEFEDDVCPDCKENPCVCDKGRNYIQGKPSDPFFKEEDEKEDDMPEMSDDEIEKMADELSDDDYLDLYDDEELGIIDDESGEELEADEEEEEKLKESALMEVLSRIERMKAKTRIRRTKAKRERATKIALKRYSNTPTINKRARRLAIKLMKQRLTRGRDPSKLSVGEKERIERMIEKRKAVIGRIAMRLAPRVRKIEKARLSHSKYTQGSPNVAF